jgi:filamentous hemagglutinin family protein
MFSSKHLVNFLPVSFLFYLANVNLTLAQITVDTTVGSQVKNSTDIIEIIGGTQTGKNLFHSFVEFSVEANQTAYFNNSLDVNNIITRITGNNISKIDGKLQANGDANLFLLNPNGIIFGSQSQLDLGGSFLATTASKIKFADGTEFSTTELKENNLLTISVPIGLQFGNINGKIVNNSIATPGGQTTQFRNPMGLTLNEGKTLALIGGEVNIVQGNATVTNGHIELASSANNSYLTLNIGKLGWNFVYDNNQLQNIIISQNSHLDVSGGGGKIAIRGREVVIKDRVDLLNITLSDLDGGKIEIFGSQSIKIAETSALYTQVGFSLNALIAGKGGDIKLETQDLFIADGGIISAGTLSQGRAGNIQIDAFNTFVLDGVSKTRNIPSIVSTSTQGQGRGGNINIQTSKLIISNGGQIQANTFGASQGGTLTINASESVSLSGGKRLINNTLSLSSLSASSGFKSLPIVNTGLGGDLKIHTAKIVVEDGAEIAVSSFSSGNAGNLELSGDNIVISDSGRVAAETASGEGGNIFLKNFQSVFLKNNSGISTSAGGIGNGGNIYIDTVNLLGIKKSQVNANAFEGRGGNINIDLQGLFLAPDSTITASSTLGINGEVKINGANYDLDSSLLQLADNLLNVKTLIANNCQRGGYLTKGSFMMTGKGGIPLDPTQTIAINLSSVDLNSLLESEVSQNYSDKVKINTPIQKENIPSIIVEAQAAIKDSQGRLFLIPHSSEDVNYVLNNEQACHVF